LINIISTQPRRSGVTGPQKVFANLVKGLDRIGYPFVVNHHPSAARRLWIHDDGAALQYMHQPGVLPVVGPNLFVTPSDIDAGISFRDAIYLQPCDWAVGMWTTAGFGSCPVLPWAVGIDTDEFQPHRDATNPDSVLVYHKMRDPQELVAILDCVRSIGLSPQLILYDSYKEEEYKRLLQQVGLVVWHGRAESQGIALQEAMACDVPVLVCDVTSVRQTRGGYPFVGDALDYPVTAAPYFDERCGMRITDIADVSTALESMVGRRADFRPREFVLEHLSLEGQARQLVDIWERHGLSYQDGLGETLRNSRLWSGAPLHHKIRSRVDRYLRSRGGVSGTPQVGRES
jgi:glycosyltransferase involved in cell wall biosynthesis